MPQPVMMPVAIAALASDPHSFVRLVAGKPAPEISGAK